jgi:hypothetical protein
MNLETYLALAGPKYVVISKTAHAEQEVAQKLAPEPGSFVYNGTEYVAINVEPMALPDLVTYIQQQAGIEFEFTQGSGLVSLLTQEQVLALIAQQPQTE